MKIEITILPEEIDSFCALLLALKEEESKPEEPEIPEDILKNLDENLGRLFGRLS